MTTDEERGAEFVRLREVITDVSIESARELFDKGVRVTPLLPVKRTLYVVCNRLLDPEENRHCEYDGDVEFTDGRGRCPWCRSLLSESEGEVPRGDPERAGR